MCTNEEVGGSLLGADGFEAYSYSEKGVDNYGFSTTTQIPSWFDVRVFYVRVSSCPSIEAPEHLRMRYPPRGITAALEVNGARIAPSEEVVVKLRRDRVDTGSSEVTYVSTASFRTSGSVSFEVCHRGESLLRGCLERSEPTLDPLDSYDSTSSASTQSKTLKLGWNMDCSCSVGPQGCIFLKGRQDLFTGSPSSMEVCVVGRYSGFPVILTQTVQLTARRRTVRRGVLDAIPEGDESEKSHQERSLAVLYGQDVSKRPVYKDSSDRTVAGLEKYYIDNGGYAENEDGDLSWFNAGVRVGVGVGLGMCLGVGIGVGLMVRTYQATTKSLRKGFF